MEENQIEMTFSEEIVINKIYFVSGQKVMLDHDLALLYDIETKQLKRQVRRNIDRFPEDFMFELTPKEYDVSRSQNGALKQGKNIKYSPMVFTEQGVSMLSSVLNIKGAISVNIQIIFTKIRRMIADNTELRVEIEKIKSKLDNQDKNMEINFRYIDELAENKKADVRPRKIIGYKPEQI